MPSSASPLASPAPESGRVQIAPPPPMPWAFLISLALVAGLAELAYAIVNISTLPLYVKYSLGLAKYVGYAITAFLASEAVLNSPMGLLADRWGRRRLMVFGPMISVFTCGATALLGRLAFLHPNNGTGGAHAEPWLLIIALLFLRLLDGAGAAMLWPSIFAAVGDRVAKARETTAMSVLNVTYMLGLAFGPLVGGTLNDLYAGKRGLEQTDPLRYAPSFIAAAACFLACAVIAMIVAPSGRSAREAATVGKNSAANPDNAATTERAPDAHGATSLADVVAALRRSPALLVLVFVIFLGIGLIAPNVKLFTMEQFKVSETVFGRLLLIPALLVASLSVPLGRLGDLWGKARAIHVGLAVCASSLWIILLWEHVAVMAIIGSVLGIGFVLAFPAYMALISDIGGKETRGSLIGAVRTAQGIGMLLGAAFASQLYERSRQLPFLLAGVLVTSGFVISLFCIREKPAADAAAPTDPSGL